jgi:hypothetical protein
MTTFADGGGTITAPLGRPVTGSVTGHRSASEDLGPAIEGATDHRLPFLGVSVLPGRRPANPLGHQPVVLAELPLAREALPLEN